MSVQGIHGTATAPRLPASAAETGSAALARSASMKKSTEPASAEQAAASLESQPSTPRFPWLSRLTTQLAAAAQKPVTFAAPIIGDNLDKRA